MGWKANNANALSDAKFSDGSFYRESSYGDVFNASVGFAIDTGLSTSRSGKSTMDIPEFFGIDMNIDYAARDDRPDRIKKMIDNGDYPENYLEQFRDKSHNTPRMRRKVIDYSKAIAAINRDRPGTLLTDKEAKADRDATLKSRIAHHDDIMRRAPDYSDIVGLAGSMVGYSTDPVNAVSMLFPATFGAQGLSRSSLAMARFKEGAMIGIGTELMIEPLVYDWNQEIGQDYTAKDSMMNIVAAGMFNGTINGLAGAISFKTGTKGRLTKPKLKEAGMDDVEAESMMDFVDESKSAPDQNITVVDHIGKGEEAMDSSNTTHYRDREPDIDIDETAVKMKDEDGLTGDPEYDAIPDDYMIVDDNGNKIRGKNLSDSIENDISIDDAFLGCVSG